MIKDLAHRILLVEDEEGAARNLASQIRKRGHECLVARDASEAFDLLEREVFCAVVMDLKFPDGPDSSADPETGFDMLRRLNIAFPAKKKGTYLFPRIVASAHAATTDNAVRALKTGADDFYNKSVNGGDRSLGPILDEALERSGRRDHSADCPRLDRDARTRPEPQRIKLTDELRDRRIVVRFDEKPIPLQEASLRVLLHLIRGHLHERKKKGYVHRIDMGGNSPGWLGFTRLKKDIREANAGVDPDEFFQMDGHGSFRIRKKVTLGRPNTAAIRELDLDGIDELLAAIDAPVKGR